MIPFSAASLADVPVDWDEIADLVMDAYRMVAPRRLVDQLDGREPA